MWTICSRASRTLACSPSDSPRHPGRLNPTRAAVSGAFYTVLASFYALTADLWRMTRGQRDSSLPRSYSGQEESNCCRCCVWSASWMDSVAFWMARALTISIYNNKLVYSVLSSLPLNETVNNEDGIAINMRLTGERANCKIGLVPGARCGKNGATPLSILCYRGR